MRERGTAINRESVREAGGDVCAYRRGAAAAATALPQTRTLCALTRGSATRATVSCMLLWGVRRSAARIGLRRGGREQLTTQTARAPRPCPAICWVCGWPTLEASSPLSPGRARPQRKRRAHAPSSAHPVHTTRRPCFHHPTQAGLYSPTSGRLHCLRKQLFAGPPRRCHAAAAWHRRRRQRLFGRPPRRQRRFSCLLLSPRQPAAVPHEALPRRRRQGEARVIRRRRPGRPPPGAQRLAHGPHRAAVRRGEAEGIDKAMVVCDACDQKAARLRGMRAMLRDGGTAAVGCGGTGGTGGRWLVSALLQRQLVQVLPHRQVSRAPAGPKGGRGRSGLSRQP